MHFLYSDSETFHDEIIATNYRQALKKAREKHGFIGRIRRVRYNGDSIGYKAKYGFYFEIRTVY